MPARPRVTTGSLGVLALAASLALSCESPAAFRVPPGPPRPIAVDITLPVYVLGTWAVSSFTEALGIELAKYRLAIVDPRSRPVEARFEVDLGEITYRQWQEIDVSGGIAGRETALGRVRLADTGMTAVEAAAQPVATLIARQVWGVGSPAP
jgi:hypothetical protein